MIRPPPTSTLSPYPPLFRSLNPAGHPAALAAGPRLSIARDGHHLRVRKDPDVELGGLLRLGVEPQEWADLGHGSILPWVSARLFKSTAIRGGANRVMLSSSCPASNKDPLAPRLKVGGYASAFRQG